MEELLKNWFVVGAKSSTASGPIGYRSRGPRPLLGLVLILAAACAEGAPEVTETDPPGLPRIAGECATPRAGWIWCDDFETDRLASYFEVSTAGGALARVSGVGQDGSWGMRGTYRPGDPNAGSMKVAFGATPDGYIDPVDAGTARYRDIYWRMFVRTQSGWTGQGPKKLSRAMVLATRDWGQAAIGHVWTPGPSGAPELQIDPARGTDANGALRTTTYNDIPNFTWLGAVPGTTQVFSAGNANVWFCVEAHMRLNDAGQSNGVFELWVDQRLDARKADLNWLGSYSAYGINAVFLENYWDASSPTIQSRFFDNIVVSTQRIGCGPAAGASSVAIPPAPAQPSRAASRASS
jgi:hypothetical protein